MNSAILWDPQAPFLIILGGGVLLHSSVKQPHWIFASRPSRLVNARAASPKLSVLGPAISHFWPEIDRSCIFMLWSHRSSHLIPTQSGNFNLTTYQKNPSNHKKNGQLNCCWAAPAPRASPRCWIQPTRVVADTPNSHGWIQTLWFCPRNGSRNSSC